MKTFTRSVACMLVGSAAMLTVGCAKDHKEVKTPAVKESTPMAAAKPAPVVMMKDADMTHTLMSDSPIFETKPMSGATKPMGMGKKGDKVMVMTPGPKYSLVTTQGGMKGYVVTAALKPLGN